MKRVLFYLLAGIAVISCEVKPSEIHYGLDTCDYCTMTIVDKKFSAELVSSKGKSYKYDSVECMLNAKRGKHFDETMAFQLVSDFEHPGKMIDAKTATFLVSDKVSTPMAAGLIAFKSRAAAEKALKSLPGKLLTWEEVQNKK